MTEQQNKVAVKSIFEDKEEYDNNVIYGRKKKQDELYKQNTDDQIFPQKLTFDDRSNDQMEITRENNQSNRPRRADAGRANKPSMKLLF